MNPFKTLHYFDMGLPLEQASHFYQQRCQQALKLNSEPWLIVGPNFIPDNHFSWLNIKVSFFQDPMLAYLTGINQAHTALLLIPQTQKIYLFLPKLDSEKARWDGDYFGINESTQSLYQKHFGVSYIYEIDSLKEQLKILLAEYKTCAFSTCSTTAHPISKKLKQSIRACLPKSCELIDNSKSELSQRLVIDEVALKSVQKAIDISHTAFNTALKCLQTAHTENEIYGALAGSILAQSPYGASFPAIVASSKQAACLHYTDNNQALDKDGMLLIDFGVRWQAYVSDITRTIPISETFHPIDALLYNCVLKTQEYVESIVKAGITMAWLNEKCWSFLNQQLKDIVISHDISIHTDYEKAPHKVGHLIGIAVHDGDYSRRYQKEALKEGQMISNEPGFYGTVSYHEKGKKKQRPIGIRIEDMLLVTRDSCVNLSKQIPKYRP